MYLERVMGVQEVFLRRECQSSFCADESNPVGLGERIQEGEEEIAGAAVAGTVSWRRRGETQGSGEQVGGALGMNTSTEIEGQADRSVNINAWEVVS